MEKNKSKLPEKVAHSHTPEAIASRLSRDPRPSYLRDFVYGGIDGSVTTFAIVSGVWGAGLSTKMILILGAANLIADGFSMAAGNYLGSKTERDETERLRSIERAHIRHFPEGEKEEIRQIFARKGIAEPTLSEVVKAITSEEQRWIDAMLVDEYGVAPVSRSPLKSAAATFLAFAICGAIPLISFVLETDRPFYVATLLTGLAFFLVGSLKSHWSNTPWWQSGLYTLGIGAVAASMAFGVGVLLA